jgi:hypothetical protein
MAQRAVAHSRAITPKSMTDDQPGIPLDSPLFSHSKKKKLCWLAGNKALVVVCTLKVKAKRRQAVARGE